MLLSKRGKPVSIPRDPYALHKHEKDVSFKVYVFFGTSRFIRCLDTASYWVRT